MIFGDIGLESRGKLEPHCIRKKPRVSSPAEIAATVDSAWRLGMWRLNMVEHCYEDMEWRGLRQTERRACVLMAAGTPTTLHLRDWNVVPKNHLPELNALRGAIGRVLRTSWSLRTFPEVGISTVSSKTVAATAMTFTWHGCAQGIPGEMRTGNMIHFEKHSTWSWEVWIDNQSRWKVMGWQLMASCWKCMLKVKHDAICHRLFGPFAADDSLNKMLWKSCGARECKLNTNDGRESIHCKSRCVW